jgi:hypothetical protein
MPRLFKEIIMNAKKFGIIIISARALYERIMPSNIFELNMI